VPRRTAPRKSTQDKRIKYAKKSKTNTYIYTQIPSHTLNISVGNVWRN